MIIAFELAGFFAAHAIWCVSDSQTLVPMLAYSQADGGRQLERLALNDLEAAVSAGRVKLASNEMHATDAVLLFDGRIPLGDGKSDAIVIEIRAYSSPKSEAVVAVPYTPWSAGAFRVHKPKLLGWANCQDFDINAVFDSFFKGVGGHEKGTAVWNTCLDESK